MWRVSRRLTVFTSNRTPASALGCNAQILTFLPFLGDQVAVCQLCCLLQKGCLAWSRFFKLLKSQTAANYASCTQLLLMACSVCQRHNYFHMYIAVQAVCRRHILSIPTYSSCASHAQQQVWVLH